MKAIENIGKVPESCLLPLHFYATLCVILRQASQPSSHRSMGLLHLDVFHLS